MQGIHDVTLLVSNVAELREFYKQLGFQLVMQKEDDMAVFVVGGNEFVLHTAAARPTAAVGVSILVADTAVHEQRLRELGIEFDGPSPLRPGLVGIGFQDPNGNRIELLRPAESE